MKVTSPFGVHPAADLFPLITGDEFDRLVESIRDRGLDQDIVLDGDGRVLDGRNRLRACEKAGVQPRFTHYGGADLVDFVRRANLRRRDLTTGQRAAIAIELGEMDAKAAAKERQRASGGGEGRRGGDQRTVPVDLREPFPLTASDQLAEQAAVSPSTVERVIRAKREAPDLYEQVRTGTLSPNGAYTEMRSRGETEVDPPMPTGMKRSPKSPILETLRRAVDQLGSVITVITSLPWEEPELADRAPLAADIRDHRTTITRIIRQLEGNAAQCPNP